MYANKDPIKYIYRNGLTIWSKKPKKFIRPNKRKDKPHGR